MKYKEIWSGWYRGLYYEVVHWDIGNKYNPNGIWNYYVYILEACVPADKLKDFDRPLKGKYYNYMEGLIASFEWHGGITFYEKTYYNEKVSGFKLGCDFNHYFDEGIIYEEIVVAREAKATIDSIWEHVPDLKVRCRTDGKIYEVNDPRIELIEGEYRLWPKQST
jgi:hypothetical protein